MRPFFFLLIPAMLAVPAFAEETPPSISSDAKPPPAVEATREERIETLFETLKADDEGAAKAAEEQIVELWLESGSPTIDLLMRWTLGAMQKKDYGLALDLLDRIVTMRPEYAEGWNKRATVYFLVEDYGKSIADIGRVLELEPRHFGALSGLGMIFRSMGEDKRAIEAYRQALAVDPHLDNVREALDELEKKTEGEGI